MRILWLAPHPIPNRNMHVAPWISTLAEHLINKGIDLTIVTTSKRLKRKVIEYELKSYKLVVLNTPSGFLDVATVFKRRIEILKEYIQHNIHNYDLIHVHGTEHQYASAILNLKDIKPCIISIQGVIYKYKECINDILTIRRLIWEMSAPYEKRELQKFSNFFCRTHWDEACIRENNKEAKLYKVWEMLRKEFYDVEIKQFGNDILFTGGENSLKGLICCLKVFNNFLKIYKNTKLHIIGNCREVTVKSIRIKYKLSNIKTENIKLYGQVGTEEILSIYHECFCLYHPSLIDNSPNSICEAQLVGLPVLANNVGGVASLIENKLTGLLVEVNDFEKHLNSLLSLKENLNLHNYLSKNSRRIALQRHDVNTITNDTIMAYKSILK